MKSCKTVSNNGVRSKKFRYVMSVMEGWLVSLFQALKRQLTHCITHSVCLAPYLGSELISESSGSNFRVGCFIATPRTPWVHTVSLTHKHNIQMFPIEWVQGGRNWVAFSQLGWNYHTEKHNESASGKHGETKSERICRVIGLTSFAWVVLKQYELL